MVSAAGSTRSVMVVEDDDGIRLVLRTNLEDEGYRVVEAVTAEQALVQRIDEPADVARRRRFDEFVASGRGSRGVPVVRALVGAW